MTRSRFKIVATAALAVTATQAMLALPSASTEAPDEELAVASPGRLIVDTIPDDTRPLQAGQSDADVPFSPLTVRTVRTPVDVSAQIRFCFAADVPQDVRTAALRAGEAWDDALSLRGPVLEIDVHWTSFDNPSALGAAGPSSFIVHPDLPDPAVRYPVALANELLGRDLAPRDACDEDADGEVMLFLNRAAGAGTDFWHLGTDDPPPGKVDLTSVVIHELAHGLGFTGSAEVAGGSLAWPDDGGVPYAYDVHASTCERVVLNVCESGQLLPTSVGTLGPLTSDSLWFNAGLGNLRLHAPPAWDVGSSFSHLDEDHYPESSQSSLMTPFLEAGERHRTVDHATTTVLQQLGWTVSALPTTTPRIGLTSVDGGVRISFGSPDLRLGPAPEQYRVRIERLVRENNGSVSFVEGFEPLVLNEPAITVRGLVNGDFYRLAIQGLSPAGAGPEVTSGLFSPGVDGDLAAALQLTNQVYVDLREDQPSASESSSTAAAVIAMGPGPALTELLDQPEFSAHASPRWSSRSL